MHHVLKLFIVDNGRVSENNFDCKATIYPNPSHIYHVYTTQIGLPDPIWTRVIQESAEARMTCNLRKWKCENACGIGV